MNDSLHRALHLYSASVNESELFRIGYISRLCGTYATRGSTIVQLTEKDSEMTQVYGEVDVGESERNHKWET
jgi:hypothetical protein